MRLRRYQLQIIHEVRDHWAQGCRVVVVRSATGSGKTPVIAEILRLERGATASIAHRSTLIAQLSKTLAWFGLKHRIIGPKELIRECVAIHMDEFKKSFYDPHAPHGVASIDTLRNHTPDQWSMSVGLWVVDEGHHVLADNKWGVTVTKLFPNARGLLPTATANRPDGKGLGRHASGLADALVLGPSDREMYKQGFLTPYRVKTAPMTIDLSKVSLTASGEFNDDKLRKAVHDSPKLVGNVVDHYVKHAVRKLGLTFCVDIESAVEHARAFRAAGVPAEVISNKTTATERNRIMRRYRARDFYQLVSVDILGEGTDVPAVEVVSMARPTNSYIIYSQQWGRFVRLLLPRDMMEVWDDYTPEQRHWLISQSDKPYGLLLDHAGNFERHHGPPDAIWRETKWTLDDRESRGASQPSEVDEYRACLNPAEDARRLTTAAAGDSTYWELRSTGLDDLALEAAGLVAGDPLPCGEPYPRMMMRCPHCGFKPEPAERSAPEHVEGVLEELDADVLARYRGEADAVLAAPGWTSNTAVGGAIRKRHFERQEAQISLREVIAVWAGVQHDRHGDGVAEQQKRFFLTFGTDVLSAQTLGAKDAAALEAQIVEKLRIDGCVNNGVSWVRN